MSKRSAHSAVNFARVNEAALARWPEILSRWLPDGRISGGQWIARNPHLPEKSARSFRICMTTGRWIEHRTGECGGDPVSLAAYLSGYGQREAGQRLAVMIGVDPWKSP